MEKEWFSADELRGWLGLGKTKTQEILQTGQIPSYRIASSRGDSMLHNVHLSVHLSEAAHQISIDLNIEKPRQAVILDALVRSFGPNRCMVEDLDPPNRRVHLLPGGALELLERKQSVSGAPETA